MGSQKLQAPSAINDVIVILALLLSDKFTSQGWLWCLKTLLPLALLCAGSIICSWVLLVSYVKRDLVLWDKYDQEKDESLLGRPLLFPSQLTHARFFPDKYQYGIDYFLVGIPVGLRGRVGTLMSVDSEETSSNSLLQRLVQKFVWFSFDTSQYLYRGDGHLTLTGKLEHFLKEQGEDIADYPYAYLIGIPQFWWWTKGPISYWYLYSPTKELSAIIMEINNSYGEKKNAFTRLVKEESSLFDAKKTSQMQSTAQGRGQEGIQPVHFVSSAPTAKYYKGSWGKDIFASPFEKVEGWFNLRFMDPLDPSPEKGGPLHSNMTLMSLENKAKVSSRLFSVSPPIDPLSAPSWKLAIFLLKWSFVIPASIGRIVVEALRIRFRGKMPYLNKPDVKKNNIPRNASKPERVLEEFFRMYLAKLVERYPFPLELVYTPAKCLHLHPVSMRTNSRNVTSAPAAVLEIQPLTPEFYTNILNYTNPKIGFVAEMESLPQVSDPISQRIWVSDPTLLEKVLDQEIPHKGFDSRLSSATEGKLKGGSFMDSFISAQCPLDKRVTYWVARTHFLFIKHTAFGSYKSALFYEFLLRAFVLHRAWQGLWGIYAKLTVLSGSEIIVPSFFFLLLRGWTWLTGRFY